MMKPYQQRVVLERDELSEKIDKLRTFLDDQKSVQVVRADELDRLHRQHIVMRAYLAILNERIAHF